MIVQLLNGGKLQAGNFTSFCFFHHYQDQDNKKVNRGKTKENKNIDSKRFCVFEATGIKSKPLLNTIIHRDQRRR